VLLGLVVLLAWRMRDTMDSAEMPPEHAPVPAAQPSTDVRQNEGQETLSSSLSEASEEPRAETVDGKSLKKIAKAEQKRLKKEAKAEKKRES
jgi:hypothetical protein